MATDWSMKPCNVSDAATKDVSEPDRTKLAVSVLRFALLLLTTAHMIFIVLMTVFMIAGMDRHSDGIGFVAVSAAIMLLEMPFTIPAFILAVRGKALGLAACLAGFATFAYVAFWIQVSAEIAERATLQGGIGG